MNSGIKIITDLPVERWEEFKNLKVEAIKDSPSAFSYELGEAELESDDNWQNVLKRNLEGKGIIIFAEHDGKLVGIVAGRVYSKKLFKHNASIDSLYVNPNYRGKGIGELLEKTIIEKISKNPQIINILCEVASSQTASLSLQKKLGFEISGVLKDFGYFEGKYLNGIQFLKRIKK